VDWSTVVPILVGGAIALAGSVTATLMANRNAVKLLRLQTETSMQRNEAERVRTLYAKVLDTVVSVRAAVVSRGDFGESMTAQLGLTRLEYEARLRLERDGMEVVTKMNVCYDLAMSYLTDTKMYIDLAAKGETDADDFLHRRDADADTLESALDGLERVMRDHLDALDAVGKRDAAVSVRLTSKVAKWWPGSHGK
jgi:hypothetical protein